uniref:Uncharacterized protein n=1 Tax=Anopheles farauti TaxID=69004 RepID=A0A182QX69_9DIPT
MEFHFVVQSGDSNPQRVEQHGADGADVEGNPADLHVRPDLLGGGRRRETIIVWKEGASADTSQLYLPVTFVSSALITTLLWFDTRLGRWEPLPEPGIVRFDSLAIWDWE